MILPLKKVMCPTDFSDPSYRAVQAAEELAVHFSAELVLVHVVSPVPTLPSFEASPTFNVALYLREVEEAAKVSLDGVIKDRLSGALSVRAVVANGDPAHEIVRLAADEAVDLIVIATHGWTGLRRMVFGSVAEKVVRLAQIPVLTVHGSEQEV